jgi:hypothetical protein
MILYKPFGGGEVVEFDATNCLVKPCIDSTGKPVGNIHSFLGKCIAIYHEVNTLILQIDNDKWDIRSDKLEMHYFHELVDKTTHFEILSEGKLFSIRYQSWWAEIPHFLPVEPEMDQDEDFLGYIFAVWNSGQLQKSLMASWG